MSFKFINQGKHLFLTGMMLSVGLWAMPGTAQSTDQQVNAFVDALRQAAPPQSANDGMYSPWQVLPGIVASWTKQCIGQQMTPAQFDANTDAARRTVSCIARRELNKQMKATGNNETAAVRGAACWWMTGNYDGCKGGLTGAYVQKVVKYYQQQGSATQKRSNQ